MLMLRVASREPGTLTLSMPTSFDRIGGRHNFAPLRLCASAPLRATCLRYFRGAKGDYGRTSGERPLR